MRLPLDPEDYNHRVDKIMRVLPATHGGGCCPPHRGENRQSKKAWTRWGEIIGRKIIKNASWKDLRKSAQYA